jgi:hypothetical protein
MDAANQIEQWADKLQTALTTLKRIAAELDGCWGDDKFGSTPIATSEVGFLPMGGWRQRLRRVRGTCRMLLAAFSRVRITVVGLMPSLVLEWCWVVVGGG